MLRRAKDSILSTVRGSVLLTACRKVSGKMLAVKLVSEIRRENFAALVAKEASAQAAADRLGKDKAQVYQWLAEPGTVASRNIGPKSVREIEEAYGLPRGWMDHEHLSQEAEPGTDVSAAGSQMGRIDPHRLRLAMDILADLAKEQIGPDSGGFASDARLIAITYNYLLARNEPVDQSNVTDIRRGVAARIRSELSSAPPEASAA